MALVKVLGKLPGKVSVACSGGPDSMAALDFLINGRREVDIVHFNHGTPASDNYTDLVVSYAESRNIEVKIFKITGSPGKRDSTEAWWSKKRYEVFHNLKNPVVTGHNLNDVAEWWIFTSLRGNPRVTPYRNKNVIRPFLLTPKLNLTQWCDRNGVPYIHDPTNFECKNARSQIRQKIMPEALIVSPGLLKIMSKKVKIGMEV